MQFLCSEQRKAVFQVEAHLVAEHAERTRASAVGLLCSLGEYAAEQVKILFHSVLRFCFSVNMDCGSGV